MNESEIRRLLLQYEIHAARWPGYVSHPYLQGLVGRYFAWKVRRKMERMKASLWERDVLMRAGALRRVDGRLEAAPPEQPPEPMDTNERPA